MAAAQLIASNYAYASTYANPNCANPAVCLPCNPVPESEQTGKYFKAVCQLALCTVVDVRESPLSECNKTSDCVLRDGADCCAQCDGSGWVPLNKTADLCGAPAACAPCAFARPTSWDTVCLGGRCRLEGPL